MPRILVVDDDEDVGRLLDRPLALAGLPPMVLDGELAAPDERGVTHIDALSEAISVRRAERFAYFRNVPV